MELCPDCECFVRGLWGGRCDVCHLETTAQLRRELADELARGGNPRAAAAAEDADATERMAARRRALQESQQAVYEEEFDRMAAEQAADAEPDEQINVGECDDDDGTVLSSSGLVAQ